MALQCPLSKHATLEVAESLREPNPAKYIYIYIQNTKPINGAEFENAEDVFLNSMYMFSLI